jgi:hypothetical protein
MKKKWMKSFFVTAVAAVFCFISLTNADAMPASKPLPIYCV